MHEMLWGGRSVPDSPGERSLDVVAATVESASALRASEPPYVSRIFTIRLLATVNASDHPKIH